MTAFAPSSRARRPLVLSAIAALFAVLALMFTTTPAFAHDELVSSDPAADSVVEGLPDAITLTFSAELLSDGNSTVLEVTDTAGTMLNTDAPVVDGAVVTQTLSGSADGAISVAWRVVSSDGHPISGTFGFTANAVAPEPTATPTTSETASEEPTATADPTMSASETATPISAPVEEAANPLPWVLGGIGLVVVIALIVWLLGARARQQRKDSENRTAGRNDPSER